MAKRKRKAKKYDPCQGMESIISRIVGRLHVGTSDQEVAKYAESRLNKGVGPHKRRQVRACAVRMHRENQRLYSYVMR